MKKNFLKSTIVVVAVAASSLGAWRAYNAYEVTDNTLLVENIEALTQGSDDTLPSLRLYPCYKTSGNECRSSTDKNRPTCPRSTSC